MKPKWNQQNPWHIWIYWKTLGTPMKSTKVHGKTITESIGVHNNQLRPNLSKNHNLQPRLVIAVPLTPETVDQHPTRWSYPAAKKPCSGVSCVTYKYIGMRYRLYHVCICLFSHACICIYIYMYMHTCIYIYASVYQNNWIHTWLYIYIYYIYISICTYVTECTVCVR